ncbi:MAG TPA: hypothetical protein VKY74_04530 [Chloroflexia bacterium]|nr:hypothetical protein [Chloroflexia bacterium]
MPELAQRLIDLETAGLLRPAARLPDLEYVFQHALVQDAAYWSLLKAERRAIHRRIGEALEHADPARRAQLALPLAHHFQAAGDPRALHYLTLAGDQALAAYANQEAERHYRAALDLAPAAAQRAGLLAALGETLARQSQYSAAIATWRAALDGYRQLGDLDGLAGIYARMTRAAGDGGDPVQALAISREGLAALPPGRDTAAMAALFHAAATTCFHNGLPAEARRWATAALALAHELGEPGIEAEALTTLALLSGDPPALRLASLARALALAEAAGLLAIASRVHNNMAVVMEDLVGDLRGARDHYLQARAIARRRGVAAHELLYLSNAAGTSLWLGDLAAGAAFLAAMRQLLATTGPLAAAAASIALREAALLRYQGDLPAARQGLEACRAAAQARGDLQELSGADNYLGDLLLEWGDADAAAVVLAEAIAIGDRGLGWGSVLPGCLLSGLYARQGRLDDARRLLAEAQQAAGPNPGFYEQEALALATGRVAWAAGDLSASLAGFAAAAAVESRLGLRWYYARTLEEWAAVYLARDTPGDRMQARSLWQEAQMIFENLDIVYYAARARGQVESLAGPLPGRDDRGEQETP